MRFGSRAAFTRRELFLSVATAFSLVAALTAGLSQARAKSRGVTCAANLLGIGQSMHIYSNDNIEWFPQHYFEPHYEAGPIPGSFTHAIHWMGTMGSDPALRISQATSPTLSPQAGHPSRSLFVLISGEWRAPADFVCPDSGDQVDDLMNYGPDGGGPGHAELGIPGETRFDFRGYNNLSYGYQLPFGRRARPSQRLDPTMPIVADKGPYFRADHGHGKGTRTVSDRRSHIDPPIEVLDLTFDEILQLPASEWADFNSPNHRGTGQNVLAVDGSAHFADTPIAGVENNNIYTIAASLSDPRDSLIGLIPDPDLTLGPLTNTDSFIVP